MYKDYAKPEFWAKMRENAAYKPIIDCLKRNYEKSSKRSKIGYSEFISYWETGTRSGSDGAYFERESYYHSLLFLSLIYPEEEKYLKELQELIWDILNDFTWERSAHMEHMCDVEFQEIALGGTSMAAKLAQTSYWLGDRLDDLIKRRIHAEIKKRYLIPYQSNRYGWETVECNWAATCIGSMGIAFMLEFPDEFEKLRPRMDASMECFLRSYSSEGICLEGVGYWSAIGTFAHYARYLFDFTGGRDNYFVREDVHNAALFLNKAYLKSNYCIGFSDCYPQTKCEIGVCHLLHSIYPDVELLPPECYAFSDEDLDCGIMWWGIMELTMLYFNPEYMTEEKTADSKEASFFAPDAGWYVNKKKKYAIAAKGGHNDEPHNHNDVGSFHIVTENGQQLADLGPSLYVMHPEGEEYCYDVFGDSSCGHNLPIIDATPQHHGKEYSGKIEKTDNGVLIDFASAYPLPELSVLKRKIECEVNAITINDNFSFKTNGHRITERFVTCYVPEIKGREVFFGDVKLTEKTAEWSVEINEFEHISNANIHGEKILVYTVDYSKEVESSAEFEIEIEVI